MASDDRVGLILRSYATIKGIKDTAEEFGEWVPARIAWDFNAGLDALIAAGFDMSSFKIYDIETSDAGPRVRRVILMTKVNGALNFFTVAQSPDPRAGTV